MIGTGSMTHDAINAGPETVAADVHQVVERSVPDRARLQELGRQLLRRHVLLGLQRVVSSEEIVEAHFRCVITDRLMGRFALSALAIPSCINSSHRAVRRVCGTPTHSHAVIEDDEWRRGWLAMQQRTPEVNIYAGRSPKRADLYIVATGGVVSVEFKYVGRGVRDVGGCAAQFGCHAAHHAEAILVLYSGTRVPDHIIRQLTQASGTNVRALNVVGPEIPVVRGTA
jgi:hypothetical protein